MAFTGKIIRNTKTGQDIKFIQTAKDTEGKLLEMESAYNSNSLDSRAFSISACRIGDWST